MGKELKRKDGITQKSLDKWERERRASGDRPAIRNGMEFWPVGHNSTCYFYLATKDGRLFSFSQCLDEGESEIREIDDILGEYLGHD